MSRLAVAPEKFAPGVQPPGTIYRAKARGKHGKSLTYDWRSPPGSPENTAGVTAVHKLIDHHDLLLAEYRDCDAHFVCYTMRPSRTGRSETLLEQPRINKNGQAWIESQGYELWTETLVADVDNHVSVPGQEKPVHMPWANLSEGIQKARDVHKALRTAAVYVTAGGLRIVQPLKKEIPIGDAEACLKTWLSDIQIPLGEFSLEPDWRCTDWPRVFRAPNVARELSAGSRQRRPYARAALVIPECEDIVAPFRTGIVRPGRAVSRRRKPLPGAYTIAKTPAPEWLPLIDALSRALAGGYRGERHAIGLAIPGALLHHGVDRGQVPAIAREVARRAGWDLEHHWGSAMETVLRYSADEPCSGMSALPTIVQDAILETLAIKRARSEAAPVAPPSADLKETAKKLRQTLLDAPVGLTVIKAQCGLGKTMSAREVVGDRAKRSGAVKENTRSAIAVPTSDLALQVTADLRAAGVAVTRLFGPLSLTRPGGAPECHLFAPASALAVGGQSVQELYCVRCPRVNTCAATSGKDAQEGARVFVGPHELLADLIAEVCPEKGTKGAALVFIDEAPTTLDDEVYSLDDLVAAERALFPKSGLSANFEPDYVSGLAPILRAVRAWSEFAPPEETGSITRALAAARVTLSPSFAELPEVPPLDRYATYRAMSDLPFATRLGRTSQILRALWRACVRPGVRLTAYDRGGRSLAVTGLDLDIENAILGADRTGAAIDRRVVIASADAHLRLDEYRALAPDLAFHDFAAPDGAPIARTHLVINGSRARLATDDPGPIQIAARMVAEWALEAPAARSCGVVTFKRHELTVLQALESAAPSVRWEVGHYGAMRGLDRWKDFDAVATIGDPRPNLDAVSRELGGGGAEVEARYDRADAHARSELEQAHGRLRTVHRVRRGKALHVGALLPLGWPSDVEYRRPPAGRIRRPVTPGLAHLVEAAGGQRAAARAVARSVSTVHRWLEGEGRPDAADVAALRRAGTERRLSEDVATVPVWSLGESKTLPEQSTSNDSVGDHGR